jgi:hypothetical protein
MNNKLLTYIITFTLTILILAICASATPKKYKDITEKDWYWDTISQLSEKGIIDGYPDGNYKPNGNIAVSEFTKLVLTSVGQNADKMPSDKTWYDRYVRKATEIGIINKGEFTNYERNIERQEIARMLVRALKETYDENVNQYSVLIADYDTIKFEFRPFIVSATSKGLMKGYPDRKFYPQNDATRAEAATMILRFLSPESRVAAAETRNYDGVKFNNVEDVVNTNGAIDSKKVSEFAMKYFNTLRFYSKDGKAYIKGNTQTIPEGYTLNIKVKFLDKDLKPIKEIILDKKTIPTQGSFDIPVGLNKADIKDITVSYNILNAENQSYDSWVILSYYPQKVFMIVSTGKKLPFPEEVYSQW